jgi:hypothetical protein
MTPALKTGYAKIPCVQANFSLVARGVGAYSAYGRYPAEGSMPTFCASNAAGGTIGMYKDFAYRSLETA